MASAALAGQPKHASVLDPAVGIEREASANDANLGALGLLHHGVEPVGLGYLDVVIEK